MLAVTTLAALIFTLVTGGAIVFQIGSSSISRSSPGCHP